jgi:hypothetical protein
MSFGIIDIAETALESAVGIELFAVQRHRREMDKLELQVVLKSTKDLFLQHP